MSLLNLFSFGSSSFFLSLRKFTCNSQKLEDGQQCFAFWLKGNLKPVFQICIFFLKILNLHGPCKISKFLQIMLYIEHPNYVMNLFGQSMYPIGQNTIWNMMEERPYWVSVVREFPNQLILLHYNYLKNKCKHKLQFQFLALPKFWNSLWFLFWFSGYF